MKAAVVVFPGSNCDRDLALALKSFTGQAPAMVWHKENHLPENLDLICVPGGFSFGDYLRCGAIAGQAPVMRAVVDHAKRGTRVLGICNGFQILIEAGLLPGALMRNAQMKFVCKDTWLRCETQASAFTSLMQPGQLLRIPVAHHDGNYFDTADQLKRLEDQDQVAFRYVDAQGQAIAEANPNGSQENIAGIFNQRKTVLGLMPHPERAIDDQVAAGLSNRTDGRFMFESLMEALS